MSQNKDKREKKTPVPPQFYNDQLGENASEEFKSEKYTNAKKEDKPKKF